ncbi:MAG: hypothetical protein EOO24_22520 [Comamonadaceae bacterium]|nr:MAG: hypothetical protein EOO24_22520 [Comamonadaceae bacterium]
MATQTITTDAYQLFPFPRNRHHVVFEHEVFVPQPYALIDLDSFHFKGGYSLFSACRLADRKMGQLVTLELAEDEATFRRKFVPD